ncbi:MAG: hypothetical protein WA139_04290 [Candidatus Aenigmatarchaeota archaeon]
MARKKNISAALRKRNAENSAHSAVLKKGMELPINTLVVVAIAVIVILAIAAFFMGGFGGSSKDIQNRQAFLNACSAWTQSGCNNADYDSSIKDTFLVWQPVQKDQLDEMSENDQKDYLAGKCGCFGAGTGTRSSTTPTTPVATTCKAAGGNCVASETACKDTFKGTVIPKYDCKDTTPVCCKAGAT